MAPTADYFATLGPRIFDNGWNVIPLRGKRPVIHGWNRYAAEVLDDETLDEWCQRYPDCNVGLPVFGFVAIDIDVLDAARAQDIEQIADDILGDSPAVRIGRAPKSMRLYRPSGPIHSSKHHPIEIFADSGQVAAFGIHPATGREYFWPYDSPVWIPPEALPPITAPQVAAFVEAALARCGGQRAATTSGRGAVCDSPLALERRGKRGREWVEAVRRQLREARAGELHDTLISVVAALARRGFSDTAIRSFVAENFAAPREGQFAQVWEQIDPAIQTARRKWNLTPTTVPRDEVPQ